MTRAIIALLATLLAAPLFAFEIDPEHRVANEGNYCTWASLETLGRAHGIRPLCGLLEKRKEMRRDLAKSFVWASDAQRSSFNYSDYGDPEKVIQYLNDNGVKYYAEYTETRDSGTLTKHVNKYGAVVSLYAGNSHSIGCHSIVLVEYSDSWVKFYDSSQPKRSDGTPVLWTVSRQWFDKWWMGDVIVVFPEECE